MKTSLIKLAAADTEDLEILSARLQDAVGKLGDFVWLPKQRIFAALLNRYRWEDGKEGNGSRVRAGLYFGSVLSVQSHNIKQGADDAVVALLAITFTPKMGTPNDGAEDPDNKDPGGVIELKFGGGGTIRLTVECIDAELSDLTGPWEASGRPAHDGDV